MGKKESNFWAWLRDNLPKTPELHIQRIESLTSVGSPDVEGCYRGIELQIELKASLRPKRSSTKLDYDVKKSQIFWHEHRYKADGKSFILIRVGTHHSALMYLFHGRDIRTLVDCTEQQLYDQAICPPMKKAMEVLRTIEAEHITDPFG